MVDSAQLEVGTPEWWMARCLARLLVVNPYCRDYEVYHAGVQPLMFASDKFQEVYTKRFGRSPNFMPLVIDAEAERMIVQGFRFGNTGSADRAVWDIWQRNQLDADSQIVHEQALVAGQAYVMVTPGPDSPVITVEDASETVVITNPGNRRERLAGLKVIVGDEGFWEAWLHLPDGVYRYRSASKATTTSPDTGLSKATSWVPYQETEGEAWPLPQPLGVVPIVPFLNRPLRNGTGRSELEPIRGNQDAINKLRFDALVSSEYVAVPQRWAINIDIPVDPDTGVARAPFKPGVDNLWAVRRPTAEEASEYGDRVPQTTLGQFPASDLSPYLRLIEEEIGEMASISRTPYHYLLGTPTSVPPSGESLKSSEAPLVKKVVRQEVHFGESWEEVMRLALLLKGQRGKAKADAETIWSDPETRNEASHNDTILKQYIQGLLPDDFALEELGYSAQQIERINTLKAADEAAGEAQPAGAGGEPVVPDVAVDDGAVPAVASA